MVFLQEYYWLWGLLLGILALVSVYYGVLLSPRKGWWILFFLPVLMTVLAGLLFESKFAIYISGHITGGSGVGWALGQLKKMAKE